MSREKTEKSAGEASTGPDHRTPEKAELPMMDLRTERRRDGEALRLFEEIIGRFVSTSGAPSDKRRSQPKLVPGKPHEIVLWEASDS